MPVGPPASKWPWPSRPSAFPCGRPTGEGVERDCCRGEGFMEEEIVMKGGRGLLWERGLL